MKNMFVIMLGVLFAFPGFSQNGLLAQATEYLIQEDVPAALYRYAFLPTDLQNMMPSEVEQFIFEYIEHTNAAQSLNKRVLRKGPLSLHFREFPGGYFSDEIRYHHIAMNLGEIIRRM